MIGPREHLQIVDWRAEQEECKNILNNRGGVGNTKAASNNSFRISLRLIRKPDAWCKAPVPHSIWISAITVRPCDKWLSRDRVEGRNLICWRVNRGKCLPSKAISQSEIIPNLKDILNIGCIVMSLEIGFRRSMVTDGDKWKPQ